MNFPKHIFVLGHRGVGKQGYSNIPENSLLAFKTAFEKYNLDLVECDVRKTKDGKIVVIHDSSVDRTTDIKGEVNNLTYEQIKKAKLQGTEERVPLLEELLDLIAEKKNRKLFLEIKDKDGGCVKESIALIEKKNLVDRVNIISFEYSSLKVARELNKNITIGYLSRVKEVDWKSLNDINVYNIGVKWIVVDEEFSESASKANIKFWVYNPRSAEQINKILKVDGLNGMGTDTPTITLDTVHEFNKKHYNAEGLH